MSPFETLPQVTEFYNALLQSFPFLQLPNKFGYKLQLWKPKTATVNQLSYTLKGWGQLDIKNH